MQDLTSLDNFPIGIRRGASLSQLPSLLQPRVLHLRIAEGEWTSSAMLYAKRPH